MMPSRVHKSVRRSNRQKGVSHNLLCLSDSPIRTNRSRRGTKASTNETAVVESQELTPLPVQQSDSTNSEHTEEYVPPEVEEEEEELEVETVVCGKKHPSKNYTLIQLYDKWVDVRNKLGDKRKEVEALQKQVSKDKKTIAALKKDVEKADTNDSRVFQLQDELESVQKKFLLEKDKVGTLKKTSKSSTDCTTKMLACMKTTYETMCTKKDFEYKSELCDLKLQFKETELKYNNLVQENARLNDEIVRLKKNTTQVNELKVASLKSEIQIKSMVDKSNLK